MYIHLSQKDVRPLYEQIVDQVKGLIMDGTLSAGENLPSIRQLAQQLLTSVITVRRAYDELEHQGYIYTRPGLGTFVSEISEGDLARMRQEQAIELLSTAIQKCRVLGLGKEEIEDVIENLLEQLDQPKEDRHDNRS